MYFGFLDLEKAFDRVPREVVRWALRKSDVDEYLVIGHPRCGCFCLDPCFGKLVNW